jgi:hypothetical protein
MVIDNRKIALRVQKRRFIFIPVLTTMIVTLWYVSPDSDFIFGIHRYVYMGTVIVAYLVFYFWGTLRGYQYFYYNDMGVKLIIKYYSLSPMNKRQHTVEIGKSSFHSFQVLKKWWGLRSYLLLYQQMPSGIAKYPPISLGLLTKKDLENIRASLMLFQKNN